MSGGSYNYLCQAYDADELLQKQSELQEMSDRLAVLGYATDAAMETQSLLLEIRRFRNRAESISKRLRELWRAIEWWDSSDSGEDEVIKALAKYRGEKEEGE